MENKTSSSTQIEIRELHAKGFTFRCRVCGMENAGEPVILLHDFPARLSCNWYRANRELPV